MIKCQTCGTENLDGSQFCDECGTGLRRDAVPDAAALVAAYQAPLSEPSFNVASVTSIGIEPVVGLSEPTPAEDAIAAKPAGVHGSLTIERGASVGKQFDLVAEESYVGRWDADNGIFPDVDLDAHDPEAKVSRRHARIAFHGGKHTIEDLGSTNGTYINRGRRLIPGTPNILSDGDEIIVGKTFLRFKTNK